MSPQADDVDAAPWAAEVLAEADEPMNTKSR